MKASERAKTMAEKTRERAERRKNAGGGLSTLNLSEGVELYKPEKGTAKFDILPYRVSVSTHPEVKEGDLWMERTYLAHRNVGPEEAFIICPRTIGKKCPICEEYNRLKKDPDVDEEVVKALRAKERQLFNVLLEGEDSPMILDISTFLFGQLLEQEIREGDDSNASFAEIKGGKTLKVRWDAKKMGKQEFVEASRIDFIDRGDLDEEEVLGAVQDLDKILIIHTYEEIEKMMTGGADDEADSKAEAEDDPPPRKIGKKPAAPPPEGVDEDAEADGDGGGVEDDPTPPRKIGKKPAKPEPEEAADAEPEAGDGEDCVACDGTGKTSKGKVCPVCEGSGKLEAEAPADPEPEAEDPPPRKIGKKPAAKPEPEDEDEQPKPRRIVRR